MNHIRGGSCPGDRPAATLTGMTPLDDRQIRDIAFALWDWLQAEDSRVKDADKRAADLIRVHQHGWKLVADAIRGQGR